MVDKFIRFLKDNHAFDEYKREIAPHQFEGLWKDIREMPEGVLADGYVFFYKDAKTLVDWEMIEQRWLEKLEEDSDEIYRV